MLHKHVTINNTLQHATNSFHMKYSLWRCPPPCDAELGPTITLASSNACRLYGIATSYIYRLTRH